VGGTIIQIVHYFDHGYLEEKKSMMPSFSYFWSKILKIIVFISLKNTIPTKCVGGANHHITQGIMLLIE
jgi:hypothetical protein